MIKRFGAIMILAAVACGSSSTEPLPTRPPPTETPVEGNPPPEEPKTIETPAPIEDTTVVPPAEPGGDYVLRITSGLPNGCAAFKGYEAERDFNRFVVAVTNLMPDPSEPIACTEIYGLHEGEVVLGGGLNVGDVYTVSVNDDWDVSFSALDSSGLGMIEIESPIENVEIIEGGGGYLMTVISRLPKGSSCSKFNGYEVNRRFAERIEVSLTHMEVSEENVPCTEDYPAVVTEIPLGDDFESGRTYVVSVNGTEVTFPEVVNTRSGDSASDEDAAPGTPAPIEHETVEVQAPIEGSAVAPPETAGGPYVLAITSGRPSGCAEFSAYHLSQSGNDYFIEVTNRVPNPDEQIACTAIYGYHDGQVTLGDSALNPGETYTVTINGELAHSFIAR